MSPRLICLHIGRGKTGTTAIQNFCTRAREALSRIGIHYVEAGDDGGHQALAKSLLAKLPEWMVPSPQLATIRADVRNELLKSPARIFLVSSENLTLVEPQVVKLYFENIFNNVRFIIIFFARSQDELAESQYNQDVKESKEKVSFSEYIENEYCQELKYDLLLEPWDRVFGRENIVAKVYNACGSSTIADFISCLPLTSTGPLTGLSQRFASRDADIVNESVGFTALEIIRLLNGCNVPKSREVYQSITRLLTNDPPAIFFSAAAARDFRSRFRDSNRRFSARYLATQIDDLGGRRYSDAERDAILAARPNFAPQIPMWTSPTERATIES